MFFLIHARPTKVILAPFTLHVRASFIFLYFYTTSRAGSHIILAQIQLIFCFCTLTFMSFLPFVMTFEARYLIAVRASQLVALTFFLNLFLTLKIRAPNHIWIIVNLYHKFHLFKLLFIFLAQLLQNRSIRDYRSAIPTSAEEFLGCSVFS